MATIVTRSGKGSPLSIAEGDANFTNLNNDKIELDDISVTTGAPSNAGALAYNNTTGVFTFQAADLTLLDFAALDDFSVSTNSASGGGALSYDNTTGVYTYTPPDLSSFVTSALQNVVEDTTPQLGGPLDVNGNVITTTIANGNIDITPNGTGAVELEGGSGINLKDANTIFTTSTNTDIVISPTSGVVELTGTAYFSAGIEEEVFLSTTTTGTYAPAATDGSIHYVVMTGSMTINGFSNAATGQTITLAFNGTGGAYGLTLGGNIMTPGGSLALTSGGFDIVTITCLDETTPSYIATAVNNFQ